MDNRDVRKLLKEIGFHVDDAHSKREIYVYVDSRFEGDHAVYLNTDGSFDINPDTCLTNFKIFHRYRTKGDYQPHVINECKSADETYNFLSKRFAYKLRDSKIDAILS